MGARTRTSTADGSRTRTRPTPPPSVARCPWPPCQPDAGKAKALGRKVRGYDDAAWAEARGALVTEGNVEKFGQNPALKQFLLNTGRDVLVEASPRDRIWGIGMGASNEHARNPLKWRGTNLLGFALMEARAALGGALGAPV